MLTALLIVIGVLAGVIAAIARRIAREVLVLASAVRELHDGVKRQQTAAGAIAPLLAVVSVPEGAMNETGTVPVPADRTRGPAAVLPNGERRIHYIRDRY